jgi:threonine/homoserine/homoserine lactone efflux protein
MFIAAFNALIESLPTLAYVATILGACCGAYCAWWVWRDHKDKRQGTWRDAEDAERTEG